MLRVQLVTSARFPYPGAREIAEDLLGRVKGGRMVANLEALASRRLERSLQKHGGPVWALDPRGEAWSSRRWAAALGEAADGGVRDLWLLVGAADGLSRAERDAAQRLIGLGPATLPSWLAVLACAEQVYRADSMHRGAPYHRE